MPLVQSYLELIKDVVWSRVKVEPNDPVRENHKYKTHRTLLFVIPIGLWGFDQLDTNMTNAGMLPMPQSFVVRRARTLFLSEGLPLPFKHPLWWNSKITFSLCGKPMIDLPTFLLADPVALIAHGASDSDMHNLLTNKELEFAWKIDPEIEIESGMGFDAALTHQVKDLPDACEFLFVLEGERRRAVL